MISGESCTAGKVQIGQNIVAETEAIHETECALITFFILGTRSSVLCGATAFQRAFEEIDSRGTWYLILNV